MVRRTPLLAILLAGGCSVRAAPYRFAGPLTSTVSLDDRAEHGRQRRVYDDGVRPTNGAVLVADLPGARDPEVPPVSGPEVPPVSGTPGVSGIRTEWAELVGLPEGLAIGRLPEPHRHEGREVALDGVDGVDALRTLVGARDERDDVTFALAVAARLRDRGAAARAATADELVTRARERGALYAPTGAPYDAGDLLVFERVAGGSLVAVILGRDDRGVVEMMYLARGVVRRGFVDPARPRTRRDDAGRVVNTYLRHGKDQPPAGTRYLAGELLAHVIDLDAVLPSEATAP